MKKSFYIPQDSDAAEVFGVLRLAMVELLDDIFGDDHLGGFESAYRHDETRFCKQNITCIKCDERIAGVMCSYGGADAPRLDERMGQLLGRAIECECERDEYYLDSVAVDERFRGLGVFRMLVSRCIKLAQENAYTKVSLLAKNPALYSGFGFEIQSELCIYDERYYKMTKRV